ncbi:heterocycloanthracin/sonorensin family bacteriocin [Brevibacillus sp. LEMMJ03]|uniref:heterocycloanthracin/sonorensin family bacteriocin n=1 Tax=Brevibacillus TaxID=55080 RepID=UPI00117D92B6|nr:heterocycloanthracin/sonorensin family bacteriocin [Brevibacillus sp. LEMMJ03]
MEGIKLDDFKKEIKKVEADEFHASEMVPYENPDYDYAQFNCGQCGGRCRNCRNCFQRCRNCFFPRCHNCFFPRCHNCFGPRCGRCF